MGLDGGTVGLKAMSMESISDLAAYEDISLFQKSKALGA